MKPSSISGCALRPLFFMCRSLACLCTAIKPPSVTLQHKFLLLRVPWVTFDFSASSSRIPAGGLLMVMQSFAGETLQERRDRAALPVVPWTGREHVPGRLCCVSTTWAAETRALCRLPSSPSVVSLAWVGPALFRCLWFLQAFVFFWKEKQFLG
uniref:Secreted protein n=1 Tax=Nothoprocta perdicaria TaxID=30464 RepID=A0A8C7EC34_NOTPE